MGPGGALRGIVLVAVGGALVYKLVHDAKQCQYDMYNADMGEESCRRSCMDGWPCACRTLLLNRETKSSTSTLPWGVPDASKRVDLRFSLTGPGEGTA